VGVVFLGVAAAAGGAVAAAGGAVAAAGAAAGAAAAGVVVFFLYSSLASEAVAGVIDLAFLLFVKYSSPAVSSTNVPNPSTENSNGVAMKFQYRSVLTLHVLILF